MIDISMPRLSDSMEEGTILKWLAAEGAQIKRGDELAEIETDKASMVYEADQEGSLHILAGEGDTLPVGAPIAQLLAEGEQPSQAGSADTGTAAAEQASVESAPVSEAAAVGAVAEAEDAAGARVKASPLARRLAAGAGIELTALAGSGPGGRVVKADVERALQAGT
ncbi:MAG: biotin/lipoyl-containing protein, partial [Solirubrobacteraceae bacterium]